MIPQHWHTREHRLSYGRMTYRKQGYVVGARLKRRTTLTLIDRVTVKVGNLIYALPKPYRHHHVIYAYNRRYPHKKLKHGGTGFMTVHNCHVDRVDGRKIIDANGQQLASKGYTHWYKLFSECLWDTRGDWTQPLGTPERELYDYYEDNKRIDALLMVYVIKKGN